MIGIKEAQKSFFNVDAVMKAVDRATARNLSKFGAFVRQTARNSIKKATKRNPTSNPGDPPKSHKGHLRRFIYFSYDAPNRAVVIGPAKLTGVAYEDELLVLEHGGKTTRKRESGRAFRATYEPRPFMGPAYAKEAVKLPGIWKDSIRK